MNTKQIVCVILLFLVIVGTIIAIFAVDSQNTNVFAVGKKEYDVSDYESYVKVWYYENNDMELNTDTLYNQFTSYKTYYRWAELAGVTLSGDEIPEAPQSGDVETLLTDYKLTEDEYMRVKTEIAIANKLYADSYGIGKVSADVPEYYKAYLNSNPDYIEQQYSITLGSNERVEDYLTTVDYRVYEVPVPSEPEKPVDESGNTIEESGDASGDAYDRAQEVLDARLKAQEVITKLKEDLSSGLTVQEAFDKLAEADSGDPSGEKITRYALTGEGGYSIVTLENGQKETLSKLYAPSAESSSIAYAWGFESHELGDGIVERVSKAERGQFSDIFETDDSVAFIYYEDVRDGLEGSELEKFQNESANFYIYQSSNLVYNRIPLKKIDYEALIPRVIKKKEEDAAKAEAEQQAESGETLELSGDEILEAVADENDVSIEVASGE